MKHTKGPWRVSEFTDSRVDGPNGPICSMVNDREESLANACLIAAAPDLLEVVLLLRFSGWLNEGQKAEIDYVLAKVEGKIK